MKYLLSQRKTSITLDSKPFAGGGEGNLYRIIAPAELRQYVVKIYHPHKLTHDREAKIKHLIDNPPHESVHAQSEHSSVVWLVDAVYTDSSPSKLMGFIMPFITGEKLEVLCLGKLPPQLSGDWKRFDFNNAQSWDLRLRLCFNVAAAIYQIHSSGRYVLVDLKPENVVVKPNGLVSLVDTDSVEVLDENGVAIYPAPVATPEYTPPEYYTHKRSERETVGESWDRFGLAVILYKLLFGIHPYTCTAHAPFDNLTSLHEKIAKGLFVHAPSKKHVMRVVPPPHKLWSQLPPALQNLFIQCFEQGHGAPTLRPTAEEWCVALLDSFSDESIKEQFGWLLFKHYNIKTVQPSREVVLPKITVTQEQWEPPTLSAAAQKAIPNLPVVQTQTTGTTTNDDWSLKKLFWLGGSFLFSIIITANIDSVSGGAKTVMIFLVFIAFMIVSGVVGLFGKMFSDEVSSDYFNSKRNAKKKEYIGISERIQQLQARLIRLVRSKWTPFKDFVTQVDNKLKDLQAFLKQKDEEANALIKEQRDLAAKVQEKFLELCKTQPLLQNIHGRSLDEIREKLEMEEQRQLSEYKQKLKRVADGTASAEEIVELKSSSKVSLELIKSKIQERFEKSKQLSLKQLEQTKHKISENYKEKAAAISQVANSRLAINAENIQHYLICDSETEQQLLETFKKNNIHNISQITLIDTANGILRFDNGYELKSNMGMSMAVLFNFWFKETQSGHAAITEKLADVGRKLDNELLLIDQEYEKQLKNLDEQLKKELLQLELAIVDEHYQTLQRQQIQAFEQTKQWLDNQRLVAEQEIKNAQNKDYEGILAQLTDTCKTEAQKVQLFIEETEKQHNQQLQLIVNDPVYTEVQKELDYKEVEIQRIIKDYSNI